MYTATYTPSFFKTKLGHASLASVTAMVAVIALTTQFQPSASAFTAHTEVPAIAEMA
ncbi:MAG: hypothetical protein AAFR88_08225 [Pseudomonadota bacterium]